MFLYVFILIILGVSYNMTQSLFVAGLDFSINDHDLKDIFSEHGVVLSAKVITDKFSGQSRGFGFVEMSSAAQAQACIKNLNDATVKNRQIVVKIKEERPSTGKTFNKRW
jgi:RNA recognition motif-containing protein